MSTSIIVCKGLRLGEVEVPRFVVRTHEFIGLILPANAWPAALELQEALTSTRPHEAIEVRGTVTMPVPLESRTWLRELMGKETVAEWFQRIGRLKSGAAAQVCASLGLEPNVAWGTVGVTARALMSLGAARLSAPDSVVFD